MQKTVTPQEFPFVQQIYKQKLIELVQDFNRNRHDREKGKSTTAEGDQVAYEMRSMALLLSGQIDISAWLNSPNLGKQLAAIKYLDWDKDIEFAEVLANRLLELEPNDGKTHDAFQAYHVLLALYCMADQLSYGYRVKVCGLLQQYEPPKGSNRVYVKDHIIKIICIPEKNAVESKGGTHQSTY